MHVYVNNNCALPETVLKRLHTYVHTYLHECVCVCVYIPIFVCAYDTLRRHKTCMHAYKM